MKFFRRQSHAVAVAIAEKPAPVAPVAPMVQTPAAVSKPPVVEGWSETELVRIYSAAPMRQLRRGEAVFAATPSTDSFFVLMDGAIQVSVTADEHAGRPVILRRGGCMAPLPASPGLSYSAMALEVTTLTEITQAVLQQIPERTQLSIYRVALASTSMVNAYIRSVNTEVTLKNVLLADYIAGQNMARCQPVQQAFVQDFIGKMPRMPAYATDLAVKLLDDSVSVQEVVEGIKGDPSAVSTVLKTVNSAQYSFEKKIESFYHACMILGFNTIYNLLVREAVQSAMPITAETAQIHAHSGLISVLCYEVASAAKDLQPQTATTIGSLHDIGKGVQMLMKTAYPAQTDYIGTFEPAQLSTELLRKWGLPERLCKIVELQRRPEFLLPEQIPAEYRRETGVLHVAHVLESLLTGQAIPATQKIYTREYMAMLGLPHTSPAEFLKERVIPNLLKNRQKLPAQIQEVISRVCGVAK